MSTIGIIDDDEDSNLILTTFLEEKHHVMAFQEWKKALKAFEKNVPDLILLDISMPDIDGYTVLKHIRETNLLKHIPVIALTAYSMPEDRQNFIKHGFNGSIAKPITNKNELLKFVELEG